MSAALAGPVPRRADEYVPGRGNAPKVGVCDTQVPDTQVVLRISDGERRVCRKCPTCEILVFETFTWTSKIGSNIPNQNFARHYIEQHTVNPPQEGSTMAKSASNKTDPKAMAAQREAGAKKAAGKSTESNGDTPAAKKASTPKPAPEPLNTDALKQQIVAYVNATATADADAPQHGAPFIQKGEVFMQLEGRGGVGKASEVSAATGLRPYLRDQGDAEIAKMGEFKKPLQSALVELGFKRQPFAYVHPERGSTAASYYRAPIAGLGVEFTAPERIGKRDAAKAERDAAAAAEAAKAAEAPAEDQTPAAA
jgi:hypothetical protein